MTTYTRAQHRQLKKDAQEFARKVRAGRTYYLRETTGGIKGGAFVGEIQFTKKPIVGLMWGSFSPEKLYEIKGGEIYEDRNHPAIRSLRTWREQAEFEEKFEAAFLGSKGHHKRLEGATRGTAFESTW